MKNENIGKATFDAKYGNGKIIQYYNQYYWVEYKEVLLMIHENHIHSFITKRGCDLNAYKLWNRIALFLRRFRG